MGMYIQLHRFEGRQAVAVLSREITAWQKRDKRNNTLKILASKANLSPVTVVKIWERQTIEPRQSTIFRILGALGFVAARLDHEDDVDRPEAQFRVVQGGRK